MTDPYAQVPSPHPPFAPQPGPRPTRGSGFGTAGLVLGIIAVVFGFIPVLLYIGFILGAIAVVFGAIALHRRGRRGLPATILGGTGLVLSLLFGGVYAWIGLGADTEAPVPAAQSAAPSSEAAAPTEAGADSDQASDEALGDSAAYPAPAGTKFQMTSTNRLDSSTADYTEWVDSYNDNYVSTNEYEQPDANMKYVMVTVHVTANTAGVDAGTLPYDLALADPAGTVYDSEYLSDVENMPSVTLGAGQSAEGQVVFQVPTEFHGGVLSFGDGSVFVKTN